MTEVVSPSSFAAARASLLAEEKAVTKELERLAAKRRALPRVLIENPSEFKFAAADGTSKTLGDLFEGRQQLMLYHFMLDSNSPGCEGCSFFADAIPYGPALNHLHARSVTFCAVARADIATVNAYKQRMGWTFPFYSAPDLFEAKEVSWKPSNGLFGLAVFIREADGHIYHTYETSCRGVEIVLGTYALLDMTPLGRREEKSSGQPGNRRHDEYDFA